MELGPGYRPMEIGSCIGPMKPGPRYRAHGRTDGRTCEGGRAKADGRAEKQTNTFLQPIRAWTSRVGGGVSIALLLAPKLSPRHVS